MNNASAKRYSLYSEVGIGRTLLLLLFFVAALSEIYCLQLPLVMAICLSPLLVVFVYLAFTYHMFTFWTLFVANYFLQCLTRHGFNPLPMSGVSEILQILALLIAIIDARLFLRAKFINPMFIGMLIWMTLCTIQMFNDTCGLGFNIGTWYTGARLMCFQLVYAYLICVIYISSPKQLYRLLKVWAVLSLISVYWAWQQKYIGFTASERSWLMSYGARTHMVNGIIRYFSVFSDAANYGCNMAATSVLFYIVALTSRIRKDRIFFLITALACTWSMFTSGTRTAIFCMIVGFMAYIFLSKSIKIAIPVILVFGTLIALLAFTKIGNGNSMIRRMRTAFDKNDASAGVRDINKEAIRKYIKDAPWGIGVGLDYSNVPANNKYRKLSTIPPDSEYVYIWVHTGYIGITVFVICNIIMILGACYIVFFRLKNKALQGIGAGICCAFVSIQLGGYGNQILCQFPNVLLFYGGLAIVYNLPYMEKDFSAEEQKRIEKEQEIRELKLRKKRESRV